MFAMLIRTAIWQSPLCAGFPIMLPWAFRTEVASATASSILADCHSVQRHNAVALLPCNIERSKLDQVQIQKECQIHHD